MKKLLVLFAVFAMTGIASAAIINGDFEAGATGWSQWWGGNSGVGIPDPIIPGNNVAGVWWSDDGVFQGMAIGPGTYTISGDLSHENLVDRIGIIQVELGDGVNTWWVQQIAIGPSDPALTWLNGSTVVDNTTAGATYMNINLMLLDQGAAPAGLARYDNISVIPEPATMALLGLGGLLLRRKRR